MAQKAAIVLALIAAATMAGGDARAQEGRAACPANHISVYNVETYRNDCIPIAKGGDKRVQALRKEQELRLKQLRREQFERTRNLALPQELVRTQQQWRTRQVTRASQ